MYVPPKFTVPDDDVAAALADAEFAHLVTHAPTGLVVTPLPMLYDAERRSLIGHVARANPHWQAAGEESVAIFAGPQAYVSPSLYATKAETGKVVPTLELRRARRLRPTDRPRRPRLGAGASHRADEQARTTAGTAVAGQ